MKKDGTGDFEFEVRMVHITPEQLEQIDAVKNKLMEAAIKAIPSIIEQMFKIPREEATNMCEVWISSYEDRNDHDFNTMVKPGTEGQHRNKNYKKEEASPTTRGPTTDTVQ